MMFITTVLFVRVSSCLRNVTMNLLILDVKLKLTDHGIIADGADGTFDDLHKDDGSFET